MGFLQHSFKGFSRRFEVGIDVKHGNEGVDPREPFLPKASFSVATIIVAADGSGDYETLQEALNHIPAGGGIIYVKEGTYIINSQIIISTNKITIIGAGAGTILQKNFAAGGIISMTDKT